MSNYDVGLRVSRRKQYNLRVTPSGPKMFGAPYFLLSSGATEKKHTIKELWAMYLEALCQRLPQMVRIYTQD